MTPAQKQIFTVLLNGGNIVHNGTSGVRLRDKKANPIQRVNPRTFSRIKPLMKKFRGLWVISPKEVLKLNKNNWAKQEYKRLKANP